MLKKLVIMSAMLSAAITSLAADETKVARKFELKDGSTVYVFKDGKMGMEDRRGRPVHEAWSRHGDQGWPEDHDGR